MTLQLIDSVPDDYQILKGARWRGFGVPEGGLEPDQTLDMLTGWSRRLIAAQGWGSWIGIAGGEALASLAVKQPLRDGVVEIGFGIAPVRRGHGHATAAVQVLLPLLAVRGVRRVRAETSPDNPASGRVLEKTGFLCVGDRLDADDGPLIQWEQVLRP